MACSVSPLSSPSGLTSGSAIDTTDQTAAGWTSAANSAFGALQNTFSSLGSLTYNFALGAIPSVPAFALPASPEPRDTSYTTPGAPTAVVLTTPPTLNVGSAPSFTGSLAIDTTGQPGPAPDPWFGDPPAVTLPELPDAPIYTAPAVPTIDDIVIPNFAPLVPIDPTVTIPTFTIPDLSLQLSYTNELWSSVNLADIATHMGRVRNGDFAIGPIIWQQIFDRAALALHRDAVARERQARRTWARNGWQMPGGLALAATEQAQQDINESLAVKALEVAVQEAVQKNEQFWQSITNGVTVETLYEKAHGEYYERGLRFAIALQEAHIAIYNALVAKFNAEIAAAQMQIESKKLEIENARLKLEEYKLYLDAALARVEIDKLELQLYIAQWEGIKAAIDVYKAELEGVKLNVDAQRLVLEAHGLNVEQFKTLVDAWAKEWDGYASKMQGEQVKAAVFDSSVKAYAARISAYTAQVGAEEARVRAATEFARLQQETARFDIERFKAEWEAVSSKLDSTARLTQADAAIFDSQVKAAATTTESYVKIAELGLDSAKATQLGQIEAARMQVEQAIAQARLAESAEEALGNIYAQLVSAVYNTRSYSESMQKQISFDTGNRANFNFNCSAD